MYGDNDDHVLYTLLEVTLTAVRSGRPLFENPLDEPLFYRRHFRKWVAEGIKERELTKDIYEDKLGDAGKGLA